MNDKQLITAQDMLSVTFLGGNIDEDKLNPCILDAQDYKLRETLGDTLYNKVLDDYFNGVLSGYYLTLYNDYIKRFLISQSAVEFLLIAGYQVTNGGIYKHVPQNSQVADLTEENNLVKNQKMKAEVNEERLLRYLCLNLANFPEYVYYYENVVNPIKNPSKGGFSFL